MKRVIVEFDVDETNPEILEQFDASYPLEQVIKDTFSDQGNLAVAMAEDAIKVVSITVNGVIL